MSRTSRYIQARINQLTEEANNTYNSEEDRAWYKRLIQELDWVDQMSDKPTRNCSLNERGVLHW